jgi:hypothetical protein
VTNEPAARKRAVPPKLRQARMADAVGMLKGSLYHRINMKDDLLYGVIQEAHHGTAARSYASPSLAGGGFDNLSFVADRHLRRQAPMECGRRTCPDAEQKSTTS